MDELLGPNCVLFSIYPDVTDRFGHWSTVPAPKNLFVSTMPLATGCMRLIDAGSGYDQTYTS